MSEQHSIPVELHEATEELIRDSDQYGIIPSELLAAIEELNQDPDPDLDPLQPIDDALQLVCQNLQSDQNETLHKPQRQLQQQLQQQQHGGSLVERYSQNQTESVTQRDRFKNLEIRRVFNIPPLGDVPDLAQLYLEVVQNLTDLAERVRPEVRRNDVIQLEIIGENVRDHIIIKYEEQDYNIVQAFEGLLDRLIQSNGYIKGSHLEVIVQVLQNPRGGARRKQHQMLDCEIIKVKRPHLYVVNNQNDSLCFAINLAHLTNPNFTDSQACERGRELQRLAGLSDQTEVTLSDICKFEQILNHKIVVYSRHSEDRTLLPFQTEFLKSPHPLYLLLFQNHYYGIKNVKALLGVKHVCSYCHRGYQRHEKHYCPDHCNLCFDPDCPTHYSEAVFCSACNRTCRTRACYLKHRRSRPLSNSNLSICQQMYKCLTCKHLVLRAADHECRAEKCRICWAKLDHSEIPLAKHLCYMQPLKAKDEYDDNIFFYDFETFVNHEGVHLPYLVCTKSLQGEEWSAYGLDCVERFVQNFRTKKYREATFIAHNAKGFDSYLILSYLVGEGMTPSIIAQGSKIICFTETDFQLRFIDSLSFLPMRLCAMPKALGFADKSKGHFPHKFSSQERLNYEGPYPRPSDYGIERMSSAEQEEFYSWYREVSQGVFNFEKEALYYCQNDVDILLEGCMKFRDQFIGETRVDPFSCATIASACMTVFLTNFLPKNTLAIPSPDNYRRQSKQYSHDSIQWLEWVAHSEKIYIDHALNKGEMQIGPHFVDGYTLRDNEEWVWEFQGCFFHGCPSCFRPDEINPLTNTPYGDLYAASVARLQELRDVYDVRTQVMIEHEWREMKKSNEEVKQFMKSYVSPEPLSPRSALYGGRTSAVRLRYSTPSDESVHYVDVTSLYPYVNANCSYPLHHPTIILKDFDDPRKYFGLIRAVVHPPRGLFFPVLPYKTSGGKLVFTLCRTCAEINYQSGPCTHDEEARALTGVWVTVELNKALELGYRVGKITEVWHFENRSSRVFVDYINTFLKGKQEASGYPPEVIDDEGRKKYIDEYQKHQGIRLEPQKIQVNPAKRQVAKLCLNSFWGKFAQRTNLIQTTLIRTPDQFFNFVFGGQYDLRHVSFLPTKHKKEGDIALIQWTYNDRTVVPSGRSSNIFIAAFTTAYARLRLYSYLERLQRNVLYTDTDSLIYVLKEGETPLELGNYLGELTDELGGDTIQEFVTAGPKSYAYQTRSQKKVMMKIKGITQTRECCEQINFDSLRGLVEGYLQGMKEAVLETPQHSIRRDKKGFLLKNTTFQKKFRVVYDKRRLLPDGTTLPFGY